MLESIALSAALHYTIKPGDTLSGIALSHGETLVTLEADNPQFAHNWNLIYPGQIVHMDHRILPGLAAVSDPPASSSSSSSTPSTAANPTTSGGDVPPLPQGAVPGSFQACVIQAESGGDATAVNASSGAGGLYGFLPSTWASLGYSGLPENAPVSVQNAAFAKEYAEVGTSAWGPYDGC